MKSPEGLVPTQTEIGEAEQGVAPKSSEIKATEISNEEVEQHAISAESHIEQRTAKILPEGKKELGSSILSMNISPKTLASTEQEFGLDAKLQEVQAEADQIASEVKSEIDSATKKTSLEKRESIIEKVTNKFPKLKDLVLAFITTTAALSNPGLAQANKPEQETKTEQRMPHPDKKTVETALKKINSRQFEAVIKEMKTEMSAFNIYLPTNSLYGENHEYTEVNRDVTPETERIGDLPESAMNIFIHSEHMSNQATVINNGKEDVVTLIKSFFYILPVEKGSISEGEKNKLKGFGSTRNEALKNALQNSVTFLGVNIASNLSSTVEAYKKMEGNKEIVPETVRRIDTRFLKSGSEHFIKEYKLTEVEQKEDGDGGEFEYCVTVEITSGQFTPKK